MLVVKSNLTRLTPFIDGESHGIILFIIIMIKPSILHFLILFFLNYCVNTDIILFYLLLFYYYGKSIY